MPAQRALVLSGGSIHGAFQAGAIAEVLTAGFVPDAIYGTSVGALNGGFLAERAGRASRAGQAVDWPGIGQELDSFWREQLSSPAQLVRQRGLIEIAWAVVRKRYAGLTDMQPLYGLVRSTLDPLNLHASPATFSACAVNLHTGEALYAGHGRPDIVDCILASTAIPIEMPTYPIDGAAHTDGGVREVAPLRRAIDEGAGEIVSIVCQAERLHPLDLRTGDLMQLAGRLMDIVVNELANNDLVRLEKVNARVREFARFEEGLLRHLHQAGLGPERLRAVREELRRLSATQGRTIDLTLIRPETEIVLDLLHFTPAQVAAVIDYGHEVARQALDKDLPHLL